MGKNKEKNTHKKITEESGEIIAHSQNYSLRGSYFLH